MDVYGYCEVETKGVGHMRRNQRKIKHIIEHDFISVAASLVHTLGYKQLYLGL
jgi:hypothetical protein